MRKKPRRAIFRPLFSVLAVILGLVLVGPISPANAGENNPPGNNGTIKVDDDSLPDCGNGDSDDNCDNGVGNDPHLNCQFYIEWYNFDANTTSQVSFAMQDNPQSSLHLTSNGNLNVQLDGDDASGASENGLDAKELYSLSFDGPAPQPQGFHVKVTVHTTGSQGNDTKSKVYWVDGCQDASAEVVLTDPTCDSGQTAAQGATENASWDPAADAVEGPGSYSFTATADAGHAFEGGDPSKTFSGELAGPLTGQQCAEVPGTQIRTEHHSEDGCDVGGVHTWDVVFTTTYAWDEEAGEYVGTEDAGVVENDAFTAYTDQEAVDLGCIEVEGEQGHQHHGGNNNHPEVKGEQAHVPTVVPSEVEAGLAGAPAGTPVGGGSSLPLWALSLGAGLFLTGAGRLRRTSRIPR
jgi:hypothetical protein